MAGSSPAMTWEELWDMKNDGTRRVSGLLRFARNDDFTAEGHYKTAINKTRFDA
jgi:hypothetical protein